MKDPVERTPVKWHSKIKRGIYVSDNSQGTTSNERDWDGPNWDEEANSFRIVRNK
jgi:hypothetical protein